MAQVLSEKIVKTLSPPGTGNRVYYDAEKALASASPTPAHEAAS